MQRVKVMMNRKLHVVFSHFLMSFSWCGPSGTYVLMGGIFIPPNCPPLFRQRSCQQLTTYVVGLATCVERAGPARAAHARIERRREGSVERRKTRTSRYRLLQHCRPRIK